MVSVSQPGGDDLRPGTTPYPNIQTAIMKIANLNLHPTSYTRGCSGDV